DVRARNDLAQPEKRLVRARRHAARLPCAATLHDDAHRCAAAGARSPPALGKKLSRDLLMVRFRPLSPDEIPWEALDAFEDGVVFQTREWLNFLAESQGGQPVVAEIQDGRTVAGYFSGMVVKKFGLRILGSSFPGWTTPYIGFNLHREYDRADMLD